MTHSQKLLQNIKIGFAKLLYIQAKIHPRYHLEENYPMDYLRGLSDNHYLFSAKINAKKFLKVIEYNK